MISVTGVRGGHGQTTVAIMLARTLAATRPVVLVTDDRDSVLAILGGADAGLLRIVDTLDETNPNEFVIIDGDTDADGAYHLAVLRGPSYLGLRALVKQTFTADGIVVLTESDRALGLRDVTAVTGLPVVATVPVTAAVARATDAGLLWYRPTDAFDDLARSVLATFPIEEVAAV